MNEEMPPPIPSQTPGTSMQPTVYVSMTPRWIAWLIASVVMPALPWLTMTSSNDSGTSVFVMTGVALVLQLAASIWVAIGFCKRRAMGVGGAVGMTIVFMLASVAIGTAIWFSVCVAKAAVDFK
jgi:hypothetical protein